MNSFKNLITKNKTYFKFQIPFTNNYVIRWYPKSNTDIHNHDGKNCDFMMIFGTLHEYRYETNQVESLYDSRKINIFEKNHINDNLGYHQLFNHDTISKLSIHRYD